MVEVVFDYKQIQTIIQANFDDSFNTIVNKFINVTHLNLDEIYFLYDDNNIKNNDRIDNIMSESDKKNNKIEILVKTMIEQRNMKKSNEIICPFCKEICKYEIKDHKIKLYECKNGHEIDN